MHYKNQCHHHCTSPFGIVNCKCTLVYFLFNTYFTGAIGREAWNILYMKNLKPSKNFSAKTQERMNTCIKNQILANWKHQVRWQVVHVPTLCLNCQHFVFVDMDKQYYDILWLCISLVCAFSKGNHRQPELPSKQDPPLLVLHDQMCWKCWSIKYLFNCLQNLILH